MKKNLSALGFMSGTSGDGVDASIINSNGIDTINIKYNRYDPYPTSLSKKIFSIKEEDIKFESLSKHDYLKANSKINKIDILFKKIEKKDD